MKRQVIFDTDIGCDDALALIPLLIDENTDVIGITAVKGNLPVNNVCENALKVCELLGKDVPVYKGCESPMVRDLLKGRDYNTLMERIHMVVDGKEILIHQKDFDLPKPTKPIETKHAVSYIVDTLRQTKEKIDIVAIGPLTNIGMAIRLDPSIVNNIDTIYIMGGGLYIGNRTPVAEANFYDDPEAAEIVLNSGAHCLVCPIEPCEMAATYGPKEFEDIKKVNNKVSEFLLPMLQGYIDRCNILFNCNIDDCCVYDYAAVAPMLDESVIIEKRKDIVHVDISGGMSDGQMVIDRRGMMENKQNVEVIYKEDPIKVKQLFINLISKVS